MSAKLYDDLPLLAVHKDHPVNRKAVDRDGERYGFIDIHHCQDELFILPTKRQSLRNYIDRAFSDLHFHTGNYVEIRNFETVIGLVNENYGIGFSREQPEYVRTFIEMLADRGREIEAD